MEYRPLGRSGLIVRSIAELSPRQAEALRHGQPKGAFLRR